MRRYQDIWKQLKLKIVISCYFWPNFYKEIQDFIQTCDLCQKVNKNRDKKKAFLKLVPIISEIFMRINLNRVGTLFPSEKNRYLLASICIAPKYLHYSCGK